MRKVEKGAVVRKVEARAVKPTKPVVVPRPVAPASAPAPAVALPPALARALAHAAEPARNVSEPAPTFAPERAPGSISAVKVFWATFGETRNAMGERITDWLGRHPELVVLDCQITQSADSGFHCLTVTLFLGGDPTRYLAEPPDPKW